MEEKKRLAQGDPWKRWGSYVSERSWGTVREDYSPDGEAWKFLTHDMARSKAYRWGEDGIAGLCDQYQKLIFSVAFWNGKDPILKERLFGLNPNEGNHGEDVKEYYFYLDATPTHSYMKYLYKYPQAAFPYDQLIQENQKRTAADREYELLDTGIFEDNRYFDIFIEYGKADPEDICIRIEVSNRGPESAPITLLPQLWFRDTWVWSNEASSLPQISKGPTGNSFSSLFADTSQLHSPKLLPFEYQLPSFYLYGNSPTHLLFTNNETNNERVFGTQNHTPYVKDAFHRFLIQKENCLNPEEVGTKAAFSYESISIPAGGSHVFYLRLTPQKLQNPLQNIQAILDARKQEADAFYKNLTPKKATEDDRRIQRQALAGMLFSKQFYFYDVETWLRGDNPQDPPPPSRLSGRNTHWSHLKAFDVISMPDKWEYPWFAAWDLSFHTIALSLVDSAFAKKQLLLLLESQYQHQSGQIPAYEWSFSDLNPPVQAWCVWHLYEQESKKDRAFLEFAFLKLTNNFSWWVNKVDREDNNVFEGGFLGLDNISIIDRSEPLGDGGFIEQSDGTGWMAFFALALMRIALELAKEDANFEKLAYTYFEHFTRIAAAIEERSIDLWDEADGFFYDAIAYPDGSHQSLKVRSFVGLIPFYGLDFLDLKELKQFPYFSKAFDLFLKNNPKLTERSLTEIAPGRYLLSLLSLGQIQRVLNYVIDADEFYSPFGLRSVSKYHEEHPFQFEGHEVGYEPGESLERIKGGNSNWRGPIWIPLNYLFLRSLKRLQEATSDSFKIKGALTLEELRGHLRNNLINLFRKNPEGKRPVHGDYEKFQNDPHWRDLLLFYEHYHGDTGRGLGASHQTGWSGLIANLIDQNYP